MSYQHQRQPEHKRFVQGLRLHTSVFTDLQTNSLTQLSNQCLDERLKRHRSPAPEAWFQSLVNKYGLEHANGESPHFLGAYISVHLFDVSYSTTLRRTWQVPFLSTAIYSIYSLHSSFQYRPSLWNSRGGGKQHPWSLDVHGKCYAHTRAH